MEMNLEVPIVDGKPDYMALFDKPNMRGYYVFMIENTETGHKYIAPAKDIEGRLKRFDRHMRNNNPESFMTSMLIMLGWDAFRITVLHSCLKYENDAKELAQELVEKHNSIKPNGYNRRKTVKE